jgi:mono/diheme cytochrome c family protein
MSSAALLRSVIRDSGMVVMLTAAMTAMASFVAMSNAVFAGDAVGLVVEPATERSAETRSAAAERGYRTLRTKPFLPPDFDTAVFERLWTVWPEPERSQAERATPTERWKLLFDYYGLVADPDDKSDRPQPLGYVTTPQQGWVMSCLACHGGTIQGQPWAGLPNHRTALQSLTEDVRLVKLQQLKPLSHLDLATINLPLNATDGTTNSVMFGVILGAYRLPDMSVDLRRPLPELVHHDCDAPPFWNVKKKQSLYADGFSPKTHRPLMQFMLLPTNSKDTVYSWEDDFKDILAWIESVEAPRYTGPVDVALADQGRVAFEQHCARCHGTYGPHGRYEQLVIAIEEVGTDPVRWRALTPEHRQWMKDGWMSRYGADPVVLDPAGYVAPPLDGIWASAPYLHNGSVPTLWHLLHPDQRPTVWKPRADGYDHQRVGPVIDEYPSVPAEADLPVRRRRYFDTTLPGKSARGHDFPNVLTPTEKQAVLEYLKTL